MKRLPIAALACAGVLFCPDAFAGPAASGGHSGALFIAQIMALLLVGRLLGELMLRFEQPAIMGQLLAGVLLGPSVLGAWFPGAEHALFPAGSEQRGMIEAMAQLGVLLLLLLTGMETDLAAVLKVRRPAMTASLFGILIPFLAGFAIGELLPDALLPNPASRLITALFCGTALSISSVKIVAVIVRDMSFEHRRVGQVLLAAAILDDTVGWILLATIFGLARHGHIDARAVFQTVSGTLLFLLASFTLGRRAVAFLIRVANDHLKSEMAVITVILLVMGLFALVTDALGVNTVLGAFVAGMLIGRSPILTRHIDEQLRGLTVALFMPVFFGWAGIEVDLSVLRQPALIGWLAAFIIAASIGKFSGSYIGGRLGLLTNRESLALGYGMNARGSTEVILATLGLAAGALNATLFTLIVTMALITTLTMPPLLRRALSRVPISDQEAKQLERVAFEARGYVPNLERLLAAVDQSASGKLAARCVGLLAGAWGMPTTVVPLRQADAVPPTKGRVEAAAVEIAMATAELPVEDAERSPRSIQIAEAPPAHDAHAAIAEVAKKGFDLLWIGTEPGADANGVVHANVSTMASGFDGHLALLFARGELAKNPLAKQPRILVAVTGTAHSRRAAEIALALAQSCHGSVTALHLIGIPDTPLWRRDLRLAHAVQGGEVPILRELADLAEQYGAPLTTRHRTAADPAAAIVEELHRQTFDLVVLGVTQRPGGTLSLGTTAQAVLAGSPQSVLLHAS